MKFRPNAIIAIYISITLLWFSSASEDKNKNILPACAMIPQDSETTNTNSTSLDRHNRFIKIQKQILLLQQKIQKHEENIKLISAPNIPPEIKQGPLPIIPQDSETTNKKSTSLDRHNRLTQIQKQILLLQQKTQKHEENINLISAPPEIKQGHLSIISQDSETTNTKSTSLDRHNRLTQIQKQIMFLQEKIQKHEENIKLMSAPNIPPEIKQNFTNRIRFLNEIKTKINSLQQKLPLYKLLHQIKKDILSSIFNQFLTIQDILTLRQISKDFQIMLQRNEKNMVMFCQDFCSKEIEEVSLLWFNLKYFLNYSYMNALNKIEIHQIRTQILKNQFAVITRSPDEQIVSWYSNKEISATHGCNCNQYNNGQKICYTQFKHAWAKITSEGNVVTGGNQNEGGNSSHVQFQLKNVKKIFSNLRAFVALKNNGQVVAWGDKEWGGKIPTEIQTKLQNIKTIFSTLGAFAALLKNGSVVAWGALWKGGTIPSEIQIQLKNVKMIFATFWSFAALLDDGRIFAWGHPSYGGKISTNESLYQPQHPVKIIFSSQTAFCALLNNNCVFAWGDQRYGGNIPDQIQNELKNNVKMVFSNSYAFTALLNDGRVFAWGKKEMGGEIPNEMQIEFKNDVKRILVSASAFGALLNDYRLFVWGSKGHSDKIPHEIQTQLQTIEPNFKIDSNSITKYKPLKFLK